MLTKVISGGQTGGDRAGLEAASFMGLETGGTAPKGYLTENGPDPSLANYGVMQHSSDKYPPRTLQNVQDSDGTIRIASDFNSAGERLTRNLCIDLQKPYMDLPVEVSPEGHAQGIKVPEQELVDWLQKHQIKTLNVAGNRESTCPGLTGVAGAYLMQVFYLMKSPATMNSSPN